MEVNEIQFKVLEKQLEELDSFAQRIHQYHLGAKPSFLYRNHWNEINDALHIFETKLAIARLQAARIRSDRAYISGNTQNISGRDSTVWEAQGKACKSCDDL